MKDKEIMEENIRRIRQKARREVFHQFVMPLCHMMQDFHNGEDEDMAFGYLESIVEYLKDRNYDVPYGHHTVWKAIQKRIDQLYGEQETGGKK